MSLWILLGCTAVVELSVLRRLRFDWVIVALVLAGTAVWVRYLGYTSMGERNYDAPSHIEYIQAFARDLRPPDVFACGACGHPPLYYALAALWSGVVRFLPFELGLQWLSLLLFFGFIVFALLMFRSRLERPLLLRLACALVVFWPSSIIHSVRLHNDALASPLMLASIYFLSVWDDRGRDRDLAAAVILAVLAMLTKANGYAVAVTVLLVACFRLRSTGWRRPDLSKAAAALVLFAATGALSVGLRESRDPSTPCQQVLGHACDGRYVPPVPDEPSRFLAFDLRRFVTRLETLPDDPARDYVLNRFAKSSLFGVAPLEDELSTPWHRALGALMSSLLLLMLALAAGALPFARGVPWRRYRAHLVATATFLSFLIAFRLRAPNPFHEDFRHVFPLLVPFCLGYAASVEHLGRVHPLLRKLGIAIALLMVASSVAFFVRPG